MKLSTLLLLPNRVLAVSANT
uniref:Uncharacterized protein n=1 Tax=Anguilla anguilla TaxID=7936 RepID=A0A0E9PYI6_ANGAN